MRKLRFFTYQIVFAKTIQVRLFLILMLPQLLVSCWELTASRPNVLMQGLLLFDSKHLLEVVLAAYKSDK